MYYFRRANLVHQHHENDNVDACTLLGGPESSNISLTWNWLQYRRHSLHPGLLFSSVLHLSENALLYHIDPRNRLRFTSRWYTLRVVMHYQSKLVNVHRLVNSELALASDAG